MNYSEKAAQDLRKLTDLTSHIDYDARYRSTSAGITANPHRSPIRNYSPSRSDIVQTSPTK
ncbi:unnamed protein product, partial [Rotaria magnacalcarata]